MAGRSFIPFPASRVSYRTQTLVLFITWQFCRVIGWDQENGRAVREKMSVYDEQWTLEEGRLHPQWRSKALRGPGSTVTWGPSLSLPSTPPSLPFPSSSPTTLSLPRSAPKYSYNNKIVIEMNIIKVALSHFCCRTTVQSDSVSVARQVTVRRW